MSETSEGKQQIGFGESGDVEGFESKKPAKTAGKSGQPQTEDGDGSSFADYEDSPDKESNKEPIKNAHIVARFSAQDKRLTVTQGTRMKSNGVAGMTKTTGPNVASKARAADLDKSHQIGF